MTGLEGMDHKIRRQYSSAYGSFVVEVQVIGKVTPWK